MYLQEMKKILKKVKSHGFSFRRWLPGFGSLI